MTRFTATSYGPPWGGIQGTGVTATGVNLRDGRPHYGVAVDPKVIPLGSHLRITPNPFGYTGTFEAFDTGGAIIGHRIDFYDWRGRDYQNRWGRRTVDVTIVGKNASFPFFGPSPFGIQPGLPGGSAPGGPDQLLDPLGSIPGVSDLARYIKQFVELMVNIVKKIADPETWRNAGKILLGFILLTMALKRLFTIATS